MKIIQDQEFQEFVLWYILYGRFQIVTTYQGFQLQYSWGLGMYAQAHIVWRPLSNVGPKKVEPHFHNYQLKSEEDSTWWISILRCWLGGPNMLNTTCKPQKASMVQSILSWPPTYGTTVAPWDKDNNIRNTNGKNETWLAAFNQQKKVVQ